jgi:hypothetical protein
MVCTSLRKRTVDLVVLPGLSTEPQDPRRPRFSFFYLHNFKEQTPGSTFVVGVGGSSASEFSEQNLLSGCPAAGLPFQ